MTMNVPLTMNAGVERQDTRSTIEHRPSHQQRTAHRAQEEVYGDAIKQDLVAEDCACHAVAGRETVHEVQRDVEGDSGDKDPGQKHEPTWLRASG